MKILSVTVAVLLLGSLGWAADGNEPDEVVVPLSNAYIPAGFDSNDRAEVVVEGYFPNTCYRVGRYEKDVNESSNEVAVKQVAYKYNGYCLQMMVPYYQTVRVGVLKASNYTVRDAANGRSLGDLPVAAATNSGPDDHMYANVRDAYVGYVDGSDRKIIIEGDLPGDCWTLTDKRVLVDGKNVLTVLPIVEKTVESNQCNNYPVPFVTTVDLPAGVSGRNLLHVRSLNGYSINKLVDL